jgi:hypothetical protein
MIFVFGTRPTTIRTFSHQWEGDSAPTQYTVMGRYFHFMFLALFPTKKFVIVREPNGKEYGISPSDPNFQQLAASKGVKTGFGLRPWWGWIVILVLFGGFKLMSSSSSKPSSSSETLSEMESNNEEISKEMEALKQGMSESEAVEDDTTGRAAAIQASIDIAVKRVGNLKEGELLTVMFPGNELPYLVYLVKKKKGDKFTLLESAYGWEDYTEAVESAELEEYKEDPKYWEPETVTRTKAELLQMAKAGPDDWKEDKGILMSVSPLDEE